MSFVVKPMIIGCVLSAPVTGIDKSLEELIHDITGRALADAGMAPSDIDGIVVAANDQYDGRAISVMAASGSVGGVGRDILSTPSASEHAFVMGALRIATGQFATQLIVSWSPLETQDLANAQHLAADPYYHRKLPLSEDTANRLQASALEAAVPDCAELADRVLEKNRAHGRVARSDAARAASAAAQGGSSAAPCVGLVAMVLASADLVSARGVKDAVALRGMGWATEPSYLGDRDLSKAPALHAAAAQAYRQAGIKDVMAEIDVAEVCDAVPHHELLSYEALGLADRRRWRDRVEAGAFARGGELPVNLSGGIATCNPVYANGLLRIAEIVKQVRGDAGAHQLAGARTGVAHAASGFAMQYQTVVVLGGVEQ